MLIVAIIGDLLSMIPIVNMVTDFIFIILLYMIGSITGTNIFSNKNIFGTIVMAVIEFVPGISLVPSFTIRVLLAKRDSE